MHDDETRLFTTPKTEVAGTHVMRVVEVPREPGLGYALPVPRRMWSATSIRSPAPASVMQPEAIGIFGLDRMLEGPRLIVCAQTLPWEVDPLEWLKYAWISSGWRVVVARTLPGDGGPRYELGALQREAGRHEVRRCVATRSGARLVRIDAACPLDQWSQWHDPLWASLDRFTLAQRRKASIESVVARSGPLVRFATPGSWDATASGTRTRVTWLAQPTESVQRGAQLRVDAVPTETTEPAAQRRDAFAERVRACGITIATPLRPVDRPLFEALLPGWQGQWQGAAELDGQAYELRVAHREQDGVTADYAALAPRPGTAHVDWMRASRAFDMAITTSSFASG